MAIEESGREKRRGRFRLWYIPVALVVLGLGAVLASRWHWSRALHQRMAAFSRQGYPVTREEIQALYPPLEPGQENAAELILEAAQSHVDVLTREEIDRLPLQGRTSPPWRGWGFSPKTRDITKRFLADNQDQLALLHRAAEIETCRYPVSLEPGSDVPFRGHDVYTSGNLLCLAALLAFDEGRTQAGVESLAAALRIAESARCVPSVYGVLTDRNIRRQTLLVLEWAMARETFTEEELHLLQEVLTIDDPPDQWAHAFATHLHWRLLYFEKPELEGSPADPSADLKLHGVLGLGLKEAVLFVDMIESYIDITGQPLNQWQAATAALDVELDQTLRGGKLLVPTNRGAFSGLLMGYVESRARIEAARVALAVERYRQAEGTPPESLAGLVPRFLEGVPADPYAGGAMLYERLEGGFVVYSVGLDGRDDGGWETPEEKRDVTFTIKRKEAANDSGRK